jgi:hypothetical protein
MPYSGVVVLFTTSTVRNSVRASDVFLSHAGADTQAVGQFAEVLRRNKLDAGFDEAVRSPPGVAHRRDGRRITVQGSELLRGKPFSFRSGALPLSCHERAIWRRHGWRLKAVVNSA